MNVVILDGRLGDEPKLEQKQNGDIQPVEQAAF